MSTRREERNGRVTDQGSPGTGPPKCQEGGRGYVGLPYSVQYEQLAAYLCETAFYCFFIGSRTVRSFIISGSMILIVQEHYRQLVLDVNLWGNGYGNLVRL
jgi:hypothetical protein